MPLPFRNNPRIISNWIHSKTKKFLERKLKRAYYDITTKKKGWLKIRFREEKKRLGGSQEREEHWYSYLEFELDSNFARDLKMFLNNYVEGNAPEVEDESGLPKNRKGTTLDIFSGKECIT